MRKRLLMGMLLPAACMASALAYDASMILPKRSIKMLPGEIASDGKTYVYSYTSEENGASSSTRFYIYDEDFQLAKEFVTIPAPTGDYSYQEQERESIPVSAEFYGEYPSGHTISIDGVSEGLTIEMVLSYLRGYSDIYEIATLEDGTQVVALSFYDEEYLGKKYPEKYYKQVNGTWNLYHATYSTNYAPYGEWKEPKKNEGIRYGYLCQIFLMPLDGADCLEYRLTRGIFSEDFNYVYPEYRKMEYSKEYTYDDTDFVYRKEWGYEYEICAFNVYDSSNKEVASLEIPEGYQAESYYPKFYRLGNKKYITLDINKEGTTEYGKDYFTAIYLIDGNNSVKLLTIAPSSKVSPRTPRQGETVTVTFDDSSISSVRTVQVVSSTGQMMQQTKIPAGQESLDIDTSRFQQGMYIVNILTEGRAHEAAKIIVR